MSHVTHIGIKRGWCQPGCSCGWPGKPTRGADAAEEQLDVHLAAVGQPVPATSDFVPWGGDAA
jgi:hypothetical protein